MGGVAGRLTIYDPEVRLHGAGFGRDVLWLTLVPLLAALAATIAPMSTVFPGATIVPAPLVMFVPLKSVMEAVPDQTAFEPVSLQGEPTWR